VGLKTVSNKDRKSNTGEGKSCLLLLDNNMWQLNQVFLDKEQEICNGGGGECKRIKIFF